MEPTSAAKGAGCLLVSGGGGVGAYLVGKEYLSPDLENLEIKDYVKATEGYEKTVEFIDTLEDTDEYVKKLGKAYYHYREIYVGETAIVNIPGGSSMPDQSERELKVGKDLLNWCKKEIKKSKEENQDKKNIQRWCIKRSTNAEKVSGEDAGKIPKEASSDFKNTDYSAVYSELEKLSIKIESSWMETHKGSSSSTGEDVVLMWCKSKAQAFYYEESKKQYELIKQYCFKDKS